jgi:hypothetical protein
MMCSCVSNQWLKENAACPEHGHEHCLHPWRTDPKRADCCICQFGSHHSTWQPLSRRSTKPPPLPGNH